MTLNKIKNLKSERGFTIIELLIVIVIIAILAAIVIVAYNGITARANTTKAQTNAATVQKVAEAFNADSGRYPASVAEFASGYGSSPSTKLPTGVTVISGLPGTNGTTFTGTEPLTTSNGLTNVTYSCFITCTNSTGGRINYWDFTTGARSTTTVYVGSAGAANGAFVVLP
jgi:prepilin-type N-terminal cleavage/methylation domain-containing protein